MTDVKQRLRTTASSFGEPGFDLSAVERHTTRAERRRRLSAGTTALVLVVIAGSIVVRGFGGGGRVPVEGLQGVENGPIAYAIEGFEGSGEGAEVAIVDPETGETVPSLSGGLSAQGDAWAPGGGRIAFWRLHEGGEPGDMDIWTMQTDGSDLRRLTSDPSGDYLPTWSPDGSQIMFFRNVVASPQHGEPGHERNAAPALMLMDDDGSSVRRIAGGDTEQAIFTALWSPDGSRILTVSDDEAQREGNPLALAVMAPDGSERRVLVEGFLNEPQWSADGSEIYFASEGSLQAVRVADGSRRVVGEGLDVQGLSNVRVSAAGDLVLYTRPIESTRSEQLWVVSTDGTDARLVADGLEWRDPSPTWAPDGTAIAFVRGADIWTIDLATGHETRVTSSPAHETTPRWGPSPAA